jgi:RNA polymerase sigma factor (sigma-70 family)
MSESPLVESYRICERDLVRFLARRVKCIITAHDLAHDIFMKIHTLEGIAPVRNPRAYLFRMASNLAADHLRTEARHSALLHEAHGMLWQGVEEATPERRLIARQALAAVRGIIADLSPTSRTIFYLSRFEGKTQREIALELGISRTTVEKHMRKVLDRLAAARDA